ncbi:MAG: ABC transporter ATP-binding protein [Acidimicrobiales bacterium]
MKSRPLAEASGANNGVRSSRHRYDASADVDESKGEVGLDVLGVSKTFDTRKGRVAALRDVSLRVGRGRFVSLIGPTGCGKSTLLRIVAGLVEADGGTVSIFGEPPERATAAKHVGFVPQSPALLPWRTVLDNVRVPFQVNRKADSVLGRRFRDPVEVLESFGLGDVLHSRPDQLSGGMQQKVAIARAFVFDPSILLMDEPFSALDELTRERQRHELLDIWQSDQKTVLFVTHSVPEAVALSDAVVVMSAQPGRVRAVIPVNLPRPRGELVEATDVFHDLERRVRSELRVAWNDNHA